MGNSDDNEKLSKYPLFCLSSRRFHLLLLILTGFCMTSYMRSNLNVTMTCMVNSTAVALQYLDPGNILNQKNDTTIQVPAECRHPSLKKGRINDYGGSLVWDNNQQKEMFKGTFWGSFMTVLISGYIADRTSPKWLFQFAFAIYVICTVLFPILVMNVGFAVSLGSRIVMGFGEGFVLPTINALVTPWFPAIERSTAVSIYTAGNQLAGFLGSPLAAALCASPWKWPSVFYVCGIIGIIWSALWCLTVSDSPSQCKHISEMERKYLESSVLLRKSKKKKRKVPWKAILTSPAVWAIFIAQCATNFISVLIQSYMPTYYKEVLYMKLEDNGFYAALPNLFLCISKVVWGMAMDRLKCNGICSATTACKISQWFSNILMAIVFLCLAFFVDCTRWRLGVVLMCFYGIGFSASVSGFFTSLLSIAPIYTGTISSLAMLFGIIGRITAPDLVGFVRQQGTVSEWRIIYITLAVVSTICSICFGFLGSAEIQSWANQAINSDIEEETLMEKKRVEQILASVKPLIKNEALIPEAVPIKSEQKPDM